MRQSTNMAVIDPAKAKGFAWLEYWARQPMRCKKCKRVSVFIEADGICGSPICRREDE